MAHVKMNAPKIIQNVAETLQKSSFSVTVSAGYNKDDELIVTVNGKSVLPNEELSMTGEILNGQLRLWA